MNSTIHWTNDFPVDDDYENLLHYLLDRNWSDGYCFPAFEYLGLGGNMATHKRTNTLFKKKLFFFIYHFQVPWL